jgi:hydrogenase nickel incorporation protein HypA/HybF
MHELSIAVNLVEYVSEQAEQAGWTSIDTVYMKVGALSGVVRSALEFSFDVAAAGTVLDASTLVIEDVPVVVYCPHCEAERTLPDLLAFACPDCGTPTPDVRQGRELEITALEVHS